MPGTRVLLVGRHGAALDGLTHALHQTDDIRVVGSAKTIDEACRHVLDVPTDVVALHIEVGDHHTAVATRELLNHDPDLRVLVTADLDNRRALHDALDAGVAGFIDRHCRLHELVDTIRTLAEGSAVYPAGGVTEAARRRDTGEHRPLSDREYEVLVALANARSVDEISRDLSLSVHTVRNHVRRLLGKLGARNQLEGVVQGFRLGVIAPQDIEDN